jgi:hypothetical protein
MSCAKENERYFFGRASASTFGDTNFKTNLLPNLGRNYKTTYYTKRKKTIMTSSISPSSDS